jgi:hypothetical protein
MKAPRLTQVAVARARRLMMNFLVSHSSTMIKAMIAKPVNAIDP